MSATTNLKRFWREFEKEESQIRQWLIKQDYTSLEESMQAWEEKVNRLMGAHFFIEYSYDNFEMTFDTGPNKTTQYLAQLCVQLAPQSITKNWIINASLPPLSQKAVQATVQMKENTYTLQDFYVFYNVQEENQSLDVKVYCPGYPLVGNPEYKKEMSMYVVELSIGLLAYESYMASIDSIDEPIEDMNFCSLVDFYETIMDIVEKKEWKVYPKVTDIYSVFQPNQDIVHDALRKDMKFIFTTHPLLIEETLEDVVQDVREDAKAKGASYQYIYYPILFEGKEDATFRQSLSKQIQSLLTKTNCGDVIGAAIGKSYAYIDCIVYDQEVFQDVFNQIKKQISLTDLHVQPF